MNTLEILKDINSLGCQDSKICVAAFKIYMELCEVRHLWDVKYSYSKELDIIYLTGRKSKDAKEEIYIPAPSTNRIDFKKITNIQNHLDKSIILAIVDPSSSILYYRMTQGVKDISEKSTKN